MNAAPLLDWTAIAAVLSASAIGVAIPGANFVAITNKALGASQREAVGMSCGVALVNCLWAIVGIVGAGALLARHPWLGVWLRLLGSAYLLWFGSRLLMRAAMLPPAPVSDAGGSQAAAFRQGVALNIVNPKSLMYYCAFLSNVAPASASGATITAMVFTVGACAVVWYSSLGWLLSFPQVSSRFRRSLPRVNRICGVLLIVLALFEILAR